MASGRCWCGWGDVAAVDNWQSTAFIYACRRPPHATRCTMLLLASCDGADLWPAVGVGHGACATRPREAPPRPPPPRPSSPSPASWRRCHASSPPWKTARHLANSYRGGHSADQPPRAPYHRAAASNGPARRTLLLPRMLANTDRAVRCCRCTGCIRRRHNGLAVAVVDVGGVALAHQQGGHR